MPTKCQHQISVKSRWKKDDEWQEIVLIEMNTTNLKRALCPAEILLAFEALNCIPDEILLFSAIHFMTDNFMVIHEAI
jgi:hypothetical protein